MRGDGATRKLHAPTSSSPSSTSSCWYTRSARCLREWQAAHKHYDAALKLCRELGDRRSEGLFLGYLGQLQIQLGQLDQADASLSSGASLMEQLGDPLGTGLLKCHQAEWAIRSGDPAEARRILLEVQRIALELGSGPNSELGLSLARVGALADRSATEADPPTYVSGS